MKMAEKKEKGAVMNAKEMISENAKAKTKIKYSERKKVEILDDTKHYKKGQIVAPHKVMAEQLIKDKIAKAV